MAKYFLCYSGVYVHVKNRIQAILKELDFDVDVFDGESQRSVTDEIEARVEAAAGIIVLCGPQSRPTGKLTEKPVAALYPILEFVYARGKEKAIALIVHRGLELHEWMKNRTFLPVQFNFWGDTDFASELPNLLRYLLGFRESVENRKKFSVFAGDGWKTKGGIVPGFLDLTRPSFAFMVEDVRKFSRDGKIIPTKYLFAHPESCSLYEALINDEEYTIARSSKIIFQEDAGYIAEQLTISLGSMKCLTIVSLGIGEGVKEGILLRHLRKNGIDVTLLVIDINPDMLYWALGKQRKKHNAGNPVSVMSPISESAAWGPPPTYEFLMGDFDRIDDYLPVLPRDRPILFLALGGTFGNQNEKRFLEKLIRVGAPQMYLLFDYQTTGAVKDNGVGGYNTEANKNFVGAMIRAFFENEDAEFESADINAVQFNQIRELEDHEKPCSVKKAQAIIIVVNTKAGPKYAGYSTRYYRRELVSFLQSESCLVIREFEHRRAANTFLLLCQLRGFA